MPILLAVVLASFLASPQSARPRSAGALDSQVKDLRYEDLDRELASIPAGVERDYFAGILANREGRLAESIRLLKKTLPPIRSANPVRAATALASLADDYVKSYRYADAAAAYEDLLTHFSHQMVPSKLQSVKDDYGVVKLLKNAPRRRSQSRGRYESQHTAARSGRLTQILR